MNPILKWSGVVALGLAIIACFLAANNGKAVFGNVVDTSYFDYFDATTGFKLGGTTFYSSAGLTLPSTALATFGGGVLYSYPLATTTIGSSETLAVSDLANYDTVLLTANVTGNTTLTLPASSTASTWLPTAGNHQKLCFVNATTTAGVTYTFAGGTGTTLLVASSSVSALGSKVIGPQKMGCFDFVRAPATATTFDILGAFTSYL